MSLQPQENKTVNPNAEDTAGADEPQTKKVKYTTVTPDDWKSKWEENAIGFHQQDVHELLKKYLEQLLDGRENITIFFPLCGKTVDMKWLADLGHNVIGVELSPKAIKDFFDEQKLEYTTEDVKEVNGSVYTSKDGKIRIYNCNLFDFKKTDEDEIGAIWDRAALVAINREDRTKYAEILLSMMSETTNYCVATLDFDESIHPGTPHFVSEENIEELFGKKCNIKQLHYQDIFAEKYAKWGLKSMNERLHLIARKK